MPKCYGIGTKECNQMANGNSIYCSGCHRKKLEQLLEQSACWLEWIKLRNNCECEENAKCVKCCVEKNLAEIDDILEKK